MWKTPWENSGKQVEEKKIRGFHQTIVEKYPHRDSTFSTRENKEKYA